MPERLYANADQLAPITSSPDAGTDIVPGNVLKVAFVELSGANFTAVTIITSAAWATAIAAVNNAKVVLTGYIDDFKIEPGDMITEGGNDASTVNGVPRLRSTGYATVSGKLSGVDSVLIKNLRKLASKAGNFQHGTRLGMFLLHEGNGISANSAGKPIPVFNVFFSDATVGGLGASDDFMFKAHLEGGWSNDRTIYEANFVAASLTNPAV